MKRSDYQTPQPKFTGKKKIPMEEATAARPTTRTIRRGFHSNIVFLQSTRTPDVRILRFASVAVNHPKG
jgi:hypothetical protein